MSWAVETSYIKAPKLQDSILQTKKIDLKIMQEYCKSSILYQDQTAQMTLRKLKWKEMCGFSGQFKKAQHFYSPMIENYSENFYLARMKMEECVEA